MYGVRIRAIYRQRMATQIQTYLHPRQIDTFHKQRSGRAAHRRQLAKREPALGQADADVKAKLVKERRNDNV